MSTIRLTVLASGNGSNFKAILDAIESDELDAEILLLVTNTANCGAAQKAIKAHIPVCTCSLKSSGGRTRQFEIMSKAITESKSDLLVLAGFNLILPTQIVTQFENKIINIHPSLLPSFSGGMSPQPQKAALEGGVKVSGCTVHLVTEELDAGPIIAQRAVAVHHCDTVDSLANRILKEEHIVLPQVIKWFSEGRVCISDGRVSIRNTE
tara:strand:+ start:3060 stop:3686 length:627 start_codon:yes stop_codon:yes gene_type:complete